MPTYPTGNLVRVSAIIHRYDKREAVYQVEASLGGELSKLVLPYEAQARRATDEARIEQETNLLYDRVLPDIEVKLSEEAKELYREGKRLTREKEYYKYGTGVL
mgnify:CR=1 FL=1